MSVALGLSAVPATATSPPPPVAHGESGVALGNLGLTLVVDRSEARLTDHGQYASTGQLGRGSYRFDMTYDYSLCSSSVTSFVATGTARLIRSDGTVVAGTATEKFDCNAGPGIPAREAVAVVLTRGTRDLLGARLLFVGTRTYLATPTGDIGPESFVFSGSSSATRRVGYWMLEHRGAVHAFGGADRVGQRVVPAFGSPHIEPTGTGNGYWLVDADGHVFAFGDARRYGNAGALLAGEVVTSFRRHEPGTATGCSRVAAASCRSATRGSTATFANIALNGSVIGSVATPDRSRRTTWLRRTAASSPSETPSSEVRWAACT